VPDSQWCLCHFYLLKIQIVARLLSVFASRACDRVRAAFHLTAPLKIVIREEYKENHMTNCAKNMRGNKLKPVSDRKMIHGACNARRA